MTIYLILAMAAGRCVSPQAQMHFNDGIQFSPGVYQFPQCEYVAPTLDVDFTSSEERSAAALNSGSRVFRIGYKIGRGFGVMEMVRRKRVEHDTIEQAVEITSKAKPKDPEGIQTYMVVGSSHAVVGFDQVEPSTVTIITRDAAPCLKRDGLGDECWSIGISEDQPAKE